METVNLTALQKDYAIFLPAISNAFTGLIGRVRKDPAYFPPSRIPSAFEYGVEGLNWLNPQTAYFNYRWSLYSAGHANLDFSKDDCGEWMIRDRDREATLIVGDSGGFQIGKGLWEGNWADPTCPQAAKKRRQVLAFMDDRMDYGMVLDIPVWVARKKDRRNKTGIHSYNDAVRATKINNDYFIQNRSGACKFLNVLQGEYQTQADDWYETMKGYCDPKKHATHFNGWAMGGQNTTDMHLILRRLVQMRHDGLLERGVHDWIHFLGTSRLEFAVIFTEIQRALRRYQNPNISISFDCASPFLAVANGKLYKEVVTGHNTKWTYRIDGGIDDKKYATDLRPMGQAIIDDHLFNTFAESPVSRRCTMKDICTYAPGDLNKIGKEGKTSWDTLTYSILMSHNTYMHIEAVQQANRSYDSGAIPKMLLSHLKHDLVYFSDVINAIFETSDRDKSLKIIEDHTHLWYKIVGTSGFTGAKALNANTTTDKFFAEV